MVAESKSRLWQIISPAVATLAVVVSIYLLWQVFELPGEKELVPIARRYFQQYGLLTVFLGAFVEGIFLVGLYLPGSFVILLAILFSEGDPIRLSTVWAAITAGLSLSYTTDYFLGRFGWYRLLVSFGLRAPLEKARIRLVSRGRIAILTSFWQINIASLTATAAGILHFPYWSFIIFAVGAAGLWMAFWTILIALLGEAAVALVSLRLVIFALILWITWLSIATWRQSRSEIS